MSQDCLTDSLCSNLPVQVQEIDMGTSVANSDAVQVQEISMGTSEANSDTVQVQETAMGTSELNSDADEPFWYSFLQNNLRKDEFRKYVLVRNEKFEKRLARKLAKGKPNGTSLSQREKPKGTSLSLRQLGRESRKALKYTDFLPLHELWKSYFRTYLDIEGLQSRGFTPDPDNKLWDDVTRLLLKADYHGALLTVEKSTQNGMTGKSGIVIFVTKNIFKLLSEDNKLRIISIPQTEFSFKFEGYTFRLVGSDLCIESSDRHCRKIKALVNLDP